MYAQPLNYDDFDIVFIETVKEPNDSLTDEIIITANKEVLPDMSLQPLGFVYDFTVNDDDGFAIIILSDNEITITEFALGSSSPYAEVTDNRIYASYLTYLYEKNGDYYTVTDNVKLPESAVTSLSEKAYITTGTITYSDERVTCGSKNANKMELALRHTAITEVGGLSGACACLAGANLSVLGQILRKLDTELYFLHNI